MLFNGMSFLTDGDPSIITGVMVPDRSGTSGSRDLPRERKFWPKRLFFARSDQMTHYKNDRESLSAHDAV